LCLRQSVLLWFVEICSCSLYRTNLVMHFYANNCGLIVTFFVYYIAFECIILPQHFILEYTFTLSLFCTNFQSFTIKNGNRIFKELFRSHTVPTMGVPQILIANCNEILRENNLRGTCIDIHHSINTYMLEFWDYCVSEWVSEWLLFIAK
jgi:hypothetical protein